MRTPSALPATKHVISSHSNSTPSLLAEVVRNRTPNYTAKHVIPFNSRSCPEARLFNRVRTPSALLVTKHVISSHSNSTPSLLAEVVRNRTPNYNYMGKALIQFYSQSWPESTGATACAHAKSSVLPATKHVISSHSNSTLHLLTKVVRNRTLTVLQASPCNSKPQTWPSILHTCNESKHVIVLRNKKCLLLHY